MTLVQVLLALAAQIAALTERIDAMTSLGMTDAEALAFGELKANVATMAEQINGVQSAIQTVIQTQAEQAESLSGVGGRLEALEGSVGALRDGVGDLSGLPTLPTP